MIKRFLRLLLCAAFIVTALPDVPSVYADDDSPPPNWRVFETKYPTDNIVVAGCSVTEDFGAKGDGQTDDTKAFQDAIDYMAGFNGGAVFIPEGRYVFKDNLRLRTGVQLIGDMNKSDRNAAVEGTVLMPYAGRGNANAVPFIRTEPYTAVRNLAIWYPEQTADNITPYPPSIRTGVEGVWGNDYPSVENVHFVNSYIGYSSSTDMSGCPVVRNITGTPLKTGLRIDGLADVGRFEHIDFSPSYWENSGLPNAPTKSGAHREFIYKRGVAVQMHRNDWSYGRYFSADGYNVGFYALNSWCSDAVNGETRIRDQFPNGENYGLKYENCYIGVAIENTSNAGIVFTNVDINNCENGIALRRSFQSKINLQDWNINATDYAVLHEGDGRLMMQDMNIIQGKVAVESGYVSCLNSTFANDAPHVTTGSYTLGSFLGNTFADENNALVDAGKKIIFDKEKVEKESIPDFPVIYTEEKKPAKNDFYNVMTPPYNAKGDNMTDDGPAIQAALDDAGKNGGGLVFLPSAMYAVKQSLIIPEGVELRGAINTPQVPTKIGATVRVYPGRGQDGGTPFIRISPTGIVRGICFDYPEQMYNNIVPYPFLLQGLGADVSIINVGIRNTYNGIDLFTNKCDNAYVEYLAGQIWHIGVRVGGGSEHCKIKNTQVNLNVMGNGSESKWGGWNENSPYKGSGPGEREAWQQEYDIIQEYMKLNFEAFVLGDTKNILFYNNFIIPAGVGLSLISENGTGPAGLSLGYGSDDSRVALSVEEVGDGGFNFINTQLVGISNFGLVPTGFQTEPGFSKKITLFGAALWGSLNSFVNLKGSGTIEMQSANFASPIERPFTVDNGNFTLINSKLDKYRNRIADYSGNGQMNFVAVNYERDGAASEVNTSLFNTWKANHNLTNIGFRTPRQSKITFPVIDESIKLKIAGSTFVIEGQPVFMDSGIIYGPVRDILNKFGYPLDWDETTQSATSISNDKKIIVPIDSIFAEVDGRRTELSGPSKIVNGKLMVPVEFIGNAIGSEVAWNVKERIIDISMPALEDTPQDFDGPTVKLNIFAVSATASQTGNPVTNLIDGKMDTRWAADGANSATFDLGSNRIVEHFSIAFNEGTARIYPFKVEISGNGKDWTTIYSGQNDGTTSELVEYKPDAPGYGRYIRYNGVGSNVNTWNNMWEFEIYGK